MTRSRSGRERTFVAYSLRTHEVVKRVAVEGLVAFEASGEFVVLVRFCRPSVCALTVADCWTPRIFDVYSSHLDVVALFVTLPHLSHFDVSSSLFVDVIRYRAPPPRTPRCTSTRHAPLRSCTL